MDFKKKWTHTKQIKNLKGLMTTCNSILEHPKDFKGFDLQLVLKVKNQLHKAIFCNSCHATLNTKLPEVDDHKTHHISLTPPCRTIICYPCSATKSEQQRIKTGLILDDLDLNEWDVFFITPTFPNIKFKDFTNKKVSELNMKLWTRFLNYLKKAAKKLGDFKLQDYIKKIEVTFNLHDDSFNYHNHLLVVCPRFSLDYKVFREVWTKAYNSYFKTNFKMLMMEINLVKNKKDLRFEISKYINKDLIFNVDIQDYKKDLIKQVKEAEKELEIAKERKYKAEKIKAIEGLISGKEKDIEWCCSHTQEQFNLWWIKLLCAMYKKQKIQFNGIFKQVQEPLNVKEIWESGLIHKVNKINDLMECILETTDPYLFLTQWIIESAIHHGQHPEKIESSKKPFIYFYQINTMIKLINNSLDKPIDLNLIPNLLNEQMVKYDGYEDMIMWYWNKYLTITPNKSIDIVI